MKRLLYIILLGMILILASCGKEAPYEYPTIFDKQNEPQISKQIKYTDPIAPIDNTEKVFLNNVDGFNEDDEFIDKPSNPVDIFNLGKEITPPMGCTSGVDC